MSRFTSKISGALLSLITIASGSIFAEDTIPVDLVVRSEIFIERSREDIWPYIIDPVTFMKSFVKVQRITGDRHTVGGINRITTIENGMENNFFAKSVRVDAPGEFVFKIYPEDSDRFLGYGRYKLLETDKGTRFVFDLYMQMNIPRTPETTEASIEATTKQLNKVTKEGLDGDHRHLKQLLEK